MPGSPVKRMADGAWAGLVAHAPQMRERTLKELFATEPDRAEMHIEAAGWYLDYAKQRVSAQTRRLLLALVEERDLRGRIDAMFRGEHINVTEDRAVLHVALRMPRAVKLVVDGVDVVAEVHRVLDRMSTFASAVRGGSHVGHTGRPIRNVVNIGIGGSDLGPAMAYDALRAYSRRDMQFRFVSNVDGADLIDALEGLDAAETLFIVASKTFTTLETLTNARAARAWLLAALGGDDAAIAKHFAAVSTNSEKVAEFGIDTANMFEFWDWVGGRYSMWSAIGLSVMIAVGPDNFRDLHAGAHAMDEHFRTAPFDANLPVLMGLLECWYRDFLDAQTQAVVPYANALVKLPSYLQQLEMESNGKSVRTDGSPVDAPTGEIVWGTVGTNGQHAYFQLLHQGTALVPIDFIGFDHPQPDHELGDHQDLLVANLLAQAEGLAFGTDDPSLPPYRVMPGNRPSSTLMASQLTPFALGALVAAYEHKVMTLGTIWGIDSFDQWGVELGKQLAQKIAAEIVAADDSDLAHDPSTNALIRRYRRRSS
jgi:glucose-6-phosphate isomerase